MAKVTRYFAPTAQGTGDGLTVGNPAALFLSGAWSTIITGFNFAAATDWLEARLTPGTYTITASLGTGSFSSGTPSPTFPLFLHGAATDGSLLSPPDETYTSDKPVWSASASPTLSNALNSSIISLSTGAILRLVNWVNSNFTFNATSVSCLIANWCQGSVTGSGGSATVVLSAFVATNNVVSVSPIFTSAYNAIIVGNDAASKIINNRVMGTAGSSGNRRGISCTVANSTVSIIGNTIDDVGGNGIHIATTISGASGVHVHRNTIAGIGGIGINLAPSAQQTSPWVVTQNCVTNTSTGGITSAFDGVYVAANRVRVNSGTAISGTTLIYGNDVSAGTDAAEYVDPANATVSARDYRVLSTASFADRNIGVSQQRLFIPDATAGTVSGYLVTYDEDGNAEDGIEIQVVLNDGPALAGTSYSRTIRKIVSTGGGLVTLPLLVNAKYLARRKYTDSIVGDQYGEWVSFETENVSPLAMPEVLGKYLTGE